MSRERLLAARGGPGRCALCFDDLASDDDADHTCDGCGTTYHLACARELAGCATLGCPQLGQRLRSPDDPSLSSARLAALREQVAQERRILQRRHELHPGAAERVAARARALTKRREFLRDNPQQRPVPRASLLSIRLLVGLFAGLLATLPVLLGFELAGTRDDDPVAWVGLGIAFLYVGWLAFLKLGELQQRHRLEPPLAEGHEPDSTQVGDKGA